MQIINGKYKRWDPQLLIDRSATFDFVLDPSDDNTVEINGNLTTDCLISYIDMENGDCIFGDSGVTSLPDFSYLFAFNDGVFTSDYGFCATDNGFITYNKYTTDLSSFSDIITNSILNISSGETKLIMNKINGNSDKITYDCGLVKSSGETYYSFNGGFLQGFYKLDGFNYQILPNDIMDCLGFEFVIRPKEMGNYGTTSGETDNVLTSGTTINDIHPNNNGIFFYIGTRAENKFARFYNSDIDKYEDRDSSSGSTANDYSGTTSGETEEEKTLLTSNAHEIESNEYSEYYTDNGFLIYDRTEDGFTTDTWNKDNVLTIVKKYKTNNCNLFLLMDRTDTGYTTDTINQYEEDITNKKEYNIDRDLYQNAFALKINQDGSIGYKYYENGCESTSENIVKERSYPNIITFDEWNVIHVKCKIVNGGTDDCGIPIDKKRKMRIYIYVNGYLKFVSKELLSFNFRALNDFYDKQIGVPYNISLGGGTQGLMESMWTDNYTDLFYKILPLEKEFAGTFIGDIRSFKIYNCDLQYNQIKNNYKYEIAK